MSDDQKSIPAGRLGRLARLAAMSARTATELTIGQAKRALGKDSFEHEKKAATQMLETLGTMKGAAMKLGQQLAMDVDSLPPEARDIVSKLFAQAPPMDFESISRVIEEELDESPDRVFAEFERTPLASASLGQVHRARLHDGTRVAVKVQYPGVAEALENDLKNASLLVGVVKGVGRAYSSDLDPKPFYEELRKEIGAETDYLREAALGAEFRAALEAEHGIIVPRSFPAQSSKRVLTMEFLEGRPLQVFAASDASPEARSLVATRLATAVLLPFLRDRMIHADPHPGNFLVTDDLSLVLLDFGAVKKFSPEFRHLYRQLLSEELGAPKVDPIRLFEESGFCINAAPDLARRLLDEIRDIAARPLRCEHYDWGSCRMVSDMRSKFSTDLHSVLKLQMPPEGLLFFRAIGGLAQNLRTLAAVTETRVTCRRLLELSAQG